MESAETSLSELAARQSGTFSSKTQIGEFDPEPVLFPERNESYLTTRTEDFKEEEQVETPSRPKFIDKILGISRARKNRKDSPTIDERFAEPSAPSFSNSSEVVDFEMNMDENLDIPSFLRRK